MDFISASPTSSATSDSVEPLLELPNFVFQKHSYNIRSCKDTTNYYNELRRSISPAADAAAGCAGYEHEGHVYTIQQLGEDEPECIFVF